MSPRKPLRTTLTPAEPARSTARPLGSWVKCELDTGSTRNCGVPVAKVSFMVSPATVAETMAGDVADADAGAGQDDEAAPDGVQVSATELAAGELACPDVGVDAPHPQKTARPQISGSRRIYFLWNAAPTR